MGFKHIRKGFVLALPALALLSGCGQLIGKDEDTAKPQAVMAQPGSGGRNEAASAAASPAPAASPDGSLTIDFGDDASKYSRDGECDDKRFAGEGLTSTPLLESDVGHDASDCRSAFKQGRLTLASATTSRPSGYATSGIDHIQWGDDASKFSRDGECDDKRFSGPGMTETPLLDSDVQHDATDCRAAYAQNRLSLRE